MRKVGIVLRNLSKAGVTRYISNVLKTIDTNPDFHKNFEFYIIFNDDNSKLIDGTPLSEFGTNFKKLKIKGKNTLLWDYIYSSLSLRKQDFDVIIYPKNNIPFTHKFVKSKKINIMHDLLDFSNVKKNRILNSIYNRFLFKISCKLADITIAVSESTKKDIVKHLEVPSNKVKVIYEAVEDIFKPVRKKKGNLEQIFN
ncbi:MAG: glycosyltransferase [Candidatus Woesearchaeota archaeon]